MHPDLKIGFQTRGLRARSSLGNQDNVPTNPITQATSPGNHAHAEGSRDGEARPRETAVFMREALGRETAPHGRWRGGRRTGDPHP